MEEQDSSAAGVCTRGYLQVGHRPFRHAPCCIVHMQITMATDKRLTLSHAGIPV